MFAKGFKCPSLRSIRAPRSYPELAQEAKNAALQARDALQTKAGPRVEAAVDWATPRVEAAWRKGVTAAAPVVSDAAKAIAPRVDEARDRIVDQILPAVVAAANSAARAAQPEPVKKHRGRKVLAWLSIAGLVGALGYWFWRQTRPVSDPWAEEDWEELDEAPEEDLSDAAGDAADAVGEATGIAVKKVTETAKKAGEAAKKVAKKAADAVHTDDDEPEES
jgi:4-amino-4-deoxy-L-arabinose transferase-like glycosyltransferase